MDQLLGHSITYRIAVGPQQGRKVFTLQTLPAWLHLYTNLNSEFVSEGAPVGEPFFATHPDASQRICRHGVCFGRWRRCQVISPSPPGSSNRCN
jgi:hypothetical protein